MNVSYLVDKEGKRIAVQIPIDEWKKVVEEFKKTQKTNETLQGLKEAFLEVRTAQKEGRQLKTLEDFLNELDKEPT